MPSFSFLSSFVQSIFLIRILLLFFSILPSSFSLSSSSLFANTAFLAAMFKRFETLFLSFLVSIFSASSSLFATSSFLVARLEVVCSPFLLPSTTMLLLIFFSTELLISIGLASIHPLSQSSPLSARTSFLAAKLAKDPDTIPSQSNGLVPTSECLDLSLILRFISCPEDSSCSPATPNTLTPSLLATCTSLTLAPSMMTPSLVKSSTCPTLSLSCQNLAAWPVMLSLTLLVLSATTRHDMKGDLYKLVKTTIVAFFEVLGLSSPSGTKILPRR